MDVSVIKAIKVRHEMEAVFPPSRLATPGSPLPPLSIPPWASLCQPKRYNAIHRIKILILSVANRDS